MDYRIVTAAITCAETDLGSARFAAEMNEPDMIRQRLLDAQRYLAKAIFALEAEIAAETVPATLLIDPAIATEPDCCS